MAGQTVHAIRVHFSGLAVPENRPGSFQLAELPQVRGGIVPEFGSVMMDVSPIV